MLMSYGDASRLRDEVVRLYRAGRLDEAVFAARRLVDLQRRIQGASHPDVAVGLANLAALIRKQGTYVQAASYRDPPDESCPDPDDDWNDPGSIDVLNRVLSLRYSGPGEFSALQTCQNIAHALLHSEAGPDDPPVEAFSALLRMVDSGDALTDAEWAETYERLRAEFGRDLASAAIKRRIIAPARGSQQSLS
jgi:hypothetical protein